MVNPTERLRHHVTGAIERGEKQAIVGRPVAAYSEPNGKKQPCSNGWYALPRNNHACRKCGARLGEQCKAGTSNQAGIKATTTDLSRYVSWPARH